MKRLVMQVALAALVSAGGTASSAQAQSQPRSTAAGPKAQGPQKPPSALAETPEPGQPRRLILKDGSYQQTIRWERKGDRIRYLSAERYQWEELPASLVDWEATEKYANQPRSASPEAQAAEAEEAAERKAEEAKTPEVAPGVRLPESGGVFVLDHFRGQPQAVELRQNGGEINRNMGKNILRAAINPLAKSKQTIEIKGAHAPVQVHVPQPAIYVNVEPPDNPPEAGAMASTGDAYRLVRMQPKKDARVVGVIEVAVYGKVTQKQSAIEIRSQPMGGGWTKITPAVPLDPGEYALVEVLGKDINLFVWDFGVNPSAPENPTAWKPAAAGRPANEKQPELQPRRKD